MVTSEQDAMRLIDEGNVIEDDGRLAEALQRYEAAIRAAPKMARAHLNLGNILLATGDTEGALTDLLECGRRLEQWGVTNPALVSWRIHAARAFLLRIHRNC